MTSHLHIPSAPSRPGEKPDFSHIDLPKAGELERPDVLIDAKETHNLPTA